MKWHFLFAVLAISGCHKKDTTPEDTEYFNCKIDGKYWSYKQSAYSNHDALRARVNAITLPGYEITGDNVNDFPQIRIDFWFVQETFLTKDTFVLTNYSDGYYAVINNPDTVGNLYEFTTDELHTGRVIFTRRSPELLQGSFFFDAYNVTTNRTVQITEGKFSLKPDQ